MLYLLLIIVEKGVKMGLTHKDSFENRKRHNIAEDKAVQYYNSIDCTLIRYGLDQLNSGIGKKEFCLIPIVLRNTPDYIVIQKMAWLVEVKGGRDILRLKFEDLESYDKWTHFCPILFFVYSTSFKKHKQITYTDIKDLIYSNDYPTDRYPDNNKEYYKIPMLDIFEKNEG